MGPVADEELGVLPHLGDAEVSECPEPPREKLPNCKDMLLAAALSHLPILRYCFGLGDELGAEVSDRNT